MDKKQDEPGWKKIKYQGSEGRHGSSKRIYRPKHSGDLRSENIDSRRWLLILGVIVIFGLAAPLLIHWLR